MRKMMVHWIETEYCVLKQISCMRRWNIVSWNRPAVWALSKTCYSCN